LRSLNKDWQPNLHNYEAPESHAPSETLDIPPGEMLLIVFGLPYKERAHAFYLRMVSIIFRLFCDSY
jgi:hypothetical protein